MVACSSPADTTQIFSLKRQLRSIRPVKTMRIETFSFGCIRIDGRMYEHDVVIDRGAVRKRDKTPSKAVQTKSGHTPLSVAEDIPWNCRRLVIGTGAYA